MAKELKPKSGQMLPSKQSPQKLPDKKSATSQPSSDKERDPIDKLRDDFTKVDANYVDYASKQRVYSENRDELKRRLGGMNNIYLQQMMMTCAMPLANGVDASSIVQCLGLYVGMRLGSKDFRDKTNMAMTKAKHDIYNYAAQKKGPDSPEAKKAAEYRRQLTKQQNGGRDPMTPRSAALTKIALTQQAYADMRVDGADVDKIMSQYGSAMSALDEQCRDDGVSMSSVNQHMCTYVGQMIKRDPKFADTFGELSYDGVTRAPGRPDPDNPGQRTWSGQYQTSDGRIYSGGFGPREPLTVESAAKRKLDLAIDAYHDMRKDGADVLQVQQSYERRMSQLSELCKTDGLSEADVNLQMQKQVGEMSKKDPAIMGMFNETSYDGVHKAPPHVNATTGIVEWSGEYQNADGSKFTGAFTPRMVMTEASAANLKIKMAETAYWDMRKPDANSKQIVKQYNRDMGVFAKQCAADGLDMRVVDQQARMVVGNQCINHTDRAVPFYELVAPGKDAVRQAEPHVDPVNPNVRIWTGEYINADGSSFDGFFKPRAPMDKDDHIDSFMQVTGNQFGTYGRNPDTFVMAVQGYNAAYSQTFGDGSVVADMNNPFYHYSNMNMCMMADDSVAFSKEDQRDFPSQVKAAVSYAYIDSFGKIADAAFRENGKNVDGFASMVQGYDAAYAAVFGNPPKQPSDDIRDNNSTYQSAVVMLHEMSQLGLTGDDVTAIKSTIDKSITNAQKSVFDKDARIAFHDKYGVLKDFRSGLQHPGRGHEQDVPADDMSKFGRGADAERRFGDIVPPTDGVPGKDIQQGG